MSNLLPKLSLSALGLLLVSVTAADVRGQEGLDGQVARLLARADAGKLDGVWEVSYQITDLEGQDDALARAIAKGAENLGDQGRLAAARALIVLTEGTALGSQILAVLAPACDSKNDQARAAAMTLLGTDGVFNRRTLPDVQELLNKATSSELVAPAVRVAAAKSLWSVGADDQRITARETLTNFLRSTDRELQIAGALALAEINSDSTSPCWAVLRSIRDEPTPHGQLARTYLQMNDERRHFETLLERSPGAPATSEGGYGRLEEIIRQVQRKHVRGDKMSREFLLESAAKGILRALDRHSSFFTSDEYKKFFFDLNREYGGIGAFVNFDQDEVFSIVRPIYSGPAYRAGLRSGDKILEVDGWETTGHTSEEIIARLKGAPETNVVVKVYRPGMDEPEDVPIVREQIQVPSVNHDILPGNIGYVELITFGANTAAELRRVLSEFDAQGVAGIALDVRSNTGGYLSAARDVVELFIEGRQRVVYTKTRAGIVDELDTRDRAVVPDTPLVVLINEYSASASEIVAGALQDHERAEIVGKRSYGKGSVQSLIPMRTSAGDPFADDNDNGVRDDWEEYEDANGNGQYDVGPRLKLTVARYYLPSDRSPNKERDADGKIVDPDWGITPNYEVELRVYGPDEAWKAKPLNELRKRGVFREYVKKYLPGNEDLFLALAESDGGEWQRYPDFDLFYRNLDTKLSRDDVRRWVRYLTREAAADLRGRAFVGARAMGDPQEDAQLQQAVSVLLEKQGKDIRKVEEYKNVLKLPEPDEKGDKKPANKK